MLGTHSRTHAPILIGCSEGRQTESWRKGGKRQSIFASPFASSSAATYLTKFPCKVAPCIEMHLQVHELVSQGHATPIGELMQESKVFSIIKALSNDI